MQLTLDRSPLKEKAKELKNYQHPLENFRQLAVAHELINNDDDMGVLREVCLSSGLDKAGWRFLNRYGEKTYTAVLPAVEEDIHIFETALFYIKWQCRGGLREPLADELGERFISCLYDAHMLKRSIGPRIARVANDYLNKLEDPIERKAFANEEWVHVLIWMRDEHPVFDRNQWRAGWETIRRRYQKWKMLNLGRIAWRCIVPSFDQIKGKFNNTPETRAARLGRVILKKYTDEEESIARRKWLEHKESVAAMRAKHEVYLGKRQEVPEELRAEFSDEELNFLERNAAWMSALVSGELQPNACEQVRLIGMARGILAPGTDSEKVWKRFQVLSNS